MGDARKKSEYLKSMSLLADAMARSSWQQFEIDVIGELKGEMGSLPDDKRFEAKVKLATRELELANLQTELMDFHVSASCGAFHSKEAAANALREIANEIESKDTELFPKPWTDAEMKAYVESIGGRFCDDEAEIDAFLKKITRSVRSNKATTKSKKRTIVSSTYQ